MSGQEWKPQGLARIIQSVTLEELRQALLLAGRVEEGPTAAILENSQLIKLHSRAMDASFSKIEGQSTIALGALGRMLSSLPRVFAAPVQGLLSITSAIREVHRAVFVVFQEKTVIQEHFRLLTESNNSTLEILKGNSDG